MRRILEKARAILTTGAVGGALGGLFGGAVLGVGAIVAGGEVTLGLYLAGVALMGGVGSFIGVGFGAMLALSSDRSLEELTLVRSAALGLVAGAMFPAVAALLTGGWLVPLELSQIALLGAGFGVLGAGLTAGLVAVAKDAAEPTLSSRPEPSLLGGREYE